MGSLEQGKHGHHGASPVEGHQDGEGAGAQGGGGKAERAGPIQPAEEMDERRSSCSLHLPNGRVWGRQGQALLGGVQGEDGRQQAQVATRDPVVIC